MVGAGADAAMHRAMEAAEHLPASLEGLPLQLPGDAAALKQKAEAASAAAKQRAEAGLASLGALGSKLVLGTHDLFEQIRWAGKVA